jgi:hypothetical protein
MPSASSELTPGMKALDHTVPLKKVEKKRKPSIEPFWFIMQVLIPRCDMMQLNRGRKIHILMGGL